MTLVTERGAWRVKWRLRGGGRGWAGWPGGCGWGVGGVEGTLGGLFFHVSLEVGHFITNEAESVMKCEPLDIGGVFIEVFAKAVEFREQGFGFHGG